MDNPKKLVTRRRKTPKCKWQKVGILYNSVFVSNHRNEVQQ